MKKGDQRSDNVMKEQLINVIIGLSCYEKGDLIRYSTEIILQLYMIYVNKPSRRLVNEKKLGFRKQ